MARKSYATMIKLQYQEAMRFFAAVLASGKNPDGTDYTIPVSGIPTAGTANVATGTATAGAASGVLIAARATRRKVIVSNTHATDAAWVGPGTVTSSNGYSLPAGQQATFETVAALNCLRSSTNNITLSFVEVYD
jgi:hypothetical protein